MLWYLNCRAVTREKTGSIASFIQNRCLPRLSNIIYGKILARAPTTRKRAETKVPGVDPPTKYSTMDPIRPPRAVVVYIVVL